MRSIDSIDFRLLDVESDLSGLNYYLDLLEKRIIKNTIDFERKIIYKLINKRGLTPDDAEWFLMQNVIEDIGFGVPKMFRYAFIVAMYAVYESAVHKIAGLIKKKKGIDIAINDLRGDFLNRGKKYFKDVLHFQFCTDKWAWERINMLSELRNSIAHANGRIEMLNKGTRQKISNWEKQRVGISSIDGFVITEEVFLRDTLNLVTASLNELIERYKEWDDHQRAQAVKTAPPKSN